MNKNISDLYDSLYDNALNLSKAQGEWKEVVGAALEAAKVSIDSILLYRIRIIFEIPIWIDIPHDLLEDDGVEKMIHQFQSAIEMHIKNPWVDSSPHITESDKTQLRKIAEDIGWRKYLSQNENITLLMAKRLKSAIQLRLIPNSHEWLSDDPHIDDNLHYGTRRHNERAGVRKPWFRSGPWKLRG